ncbi:MAG: Fe-S cluster assembly iron-binding protein IscA [Bacteroidia bacterium]|jgi:Fe-S cluster assembly iron-binding protein IscA
MRKVTVFILAVFACLQAYGQDTIQAKFSVVDACDGAEVVFTNTSKVPVKFGGANYSWTFGDGGTSTAQFPKHTYTLDDDATGKRYQVKLVVQSKSIPSEKDSIIDFVEIFPNPDATFSWLVENKGNTQDVVVDSQASKNPLNFYQWNLAGVLKSNDITPKFLYVDVKPFLDGADYDFILLVITPETCESTFTTKFNYNPLSVEDIWVEQNLIYPNPSNGTIQMKEALSKVVIRDISGHIVFEESSLINDLTLNVPEGIYFLTGELNGLAVMQKLMLK